MWVCNSAGPIENGDYITSSVVPGYGMKQHDDALHSYTVGKATIACDFSVERVPIMQLRMDTAQKKILYNEAGNATYEAVLDEAGQRANSVAITHTVHRQTRPDHVTRGIR